MQSYLLAQTQKGNGGDQVPTDVLFGSSLADKTSQIGIRLRIVTVSITQDVWKG